MDSGCCQLPSQLLMTEFRLKVLGWTCPKSIMPSWVKADSHWSVFWNALSTALNVITSCWEVKGNNPPANFHCLPFSHALITAEYVSSFAATRQCCISTRRCAAINQYPCDAVALIAEELLNTFLAAKCCVKSDDCPWLKTLGVLQDVFFKCSRVYVLVFTRVLYYYPQLSNESFALHYCSSVKLSLAPCNVHLQHFFAVFLCKTFQEDSSPTLLHDTFWVPCQPHSVKHKRLLLPRCNWIPRKGIFRSNSQVSLQWPLTELGLPPRAQAFLTALKVTSFAATCIGHDNMRDPENQWNPVPPGLRISHNLQEA